MKQLFLAFIYLFSLVATSAAQVPAKQNNTGTKPAAQSSTKTTGQGSSQDILSSNVRSAVEAEAAEQDDTYWVMKGEDLMKEECGINKLECAIEMLFEAEKAAGGDPLKAVVCSKKGDKCVPALAFAQGSVDWVVSKELYYQGQIIVENSSMFVELISKYGFHFDSNRAKAKNYLEQLMERAADDCEKPSATEDTSHWNTHRTNYCAEEVASMSALAMIALTENAQYRQKLTNNIHDLMEDMYDEPGGSVVIMGGTMALGVLGTQYAYERLEEFLMDDTIPSLAGNVWNGVNSAVSATVDNIYKATTENGRYLNRINEKFMYLDEEEAKRQGYDNTAWVHPKRQYPYANELEEVGYVLAYQSATNAHAKKLATKIIQKANQYAKDKKQMAADVHYPVIVGILDGWREKNISLDVPSKELLTLLYEGNWFDINEGTQRRVHDKAYKFGLKRNLGFKPPVKDEQKIEEFIKYDNGVVWGAKQTGDILAQMLMMEFIFAKLIVVVKNIPAAIRALQTRSQWIGTKNFITKLPRGNSNIKVVAQNGTKGAEVAPKTNVTANTAAKGQNVTSATTPKGTAAPKGSANTGSTTSRAGNTATTGGQTTTGSASSAGNTVATAVPQATMQIVKSGSASIEAGAVEAELMDPLAQQLANGTSLTQNLKNGAAAVKNFGKDYWNALWRPRKYVACSLAGPAGMLIPEGGAMAAARAERLFFEQMEPIVQKAVTATKNIRGATSLDRVTQFANEASSYAKKAASMVGQAPNASKAAKLAQQAEQAAQEAQTALDNFTKAIEIAKSKTGMTTALGNMKLLQALQAVDPLATRLPAFRSWTPIKEQVRLLKGVLTRTNTVRQSFVNSLQSIRDILSKAHLPSIDAEWNIFGQSIEAFANDANVQTLGTKINATLDQLATTTDAAAKRQLFTTLQADQAQYASLIQRHQATISSAARKLKNTVSAKDRWDFFIRYGIEQRVANVIDLTDDFHWLGQIRTGATEGLETNIVSIEQKAKRIEQAAANTTAKQAFKAKQRENQAANLVRQAANKAK